MLLQILSETPRNEEYLAIAKTFGVIVALLFAGLIIYGLIKGNKK